MENNFDRSINGMTFNTRFDGVMKLPENLLEKIKADFDVSEETVGELDKLIEIEFISGYNCCCWSEITYGVKLTVKQYDDEYNTIQSKTYSLDDDDELTNKIVHQSLEESFEFMRYLIHDAVIHGLAGDTDLEYS